MKGITITISLALVFLTVSESNAEFLYSEDDTYFGLQVSIPLGAAPGQFTPTNFEYSFLLVDKNDGIATGVTWTRDGSDTSTLGFLPPSNSFRIGESKVSQHVMPLLTDDDSVDLSMSNLTAIDGATFLIYTIAGIYVVGKILGDVLDDIADIDLEEESESAEE